MEVVQDEEAGPSGGSTYVEYEMTPDAEGAGGVASLLGGEVDQAMDDAAQSDVVGEGAEGQNEGEAYEVMMEEYAEEADNHDDGQREMEEEVVTDTHEQQQQEEENQTAADYTGEGDTAVQQQQQHKAGAEDEGEGEEDAMDRTTATHDGDDDEHDGDNDGTDYQENDENDEDEQEAEESATAQGAAEVTEEEAEVVEASSHYEHDEAAAQKEGGEEEEYTPERNETSDGDGKDNAEGATESVAGVSQEGTIVETEGESRQGRTEEVVKEGVPAAAVEQESIEPVRPAEVSHDGEEEEEEEAVVEVAEDSDEVDAPPPIRVSFNGQDFVLFPQSEVSSYTTATEAEPVAAPQLKADAGIFFESLDSLFQALRVKDSLGDFLEEGSELQISFVDLDLILREDDVYAREVTLNDIHRIHIGYGLSSSLHLDISEKARFISRYNDLAAHVSSAVDEQTVEDAEGTTTDAAQEEDDAAVQGSGEADQQDAEEAENEAEKHIEEESREAAGEVDGEGKAVVAVEGEGETEKGDVTSAVDETFITVNETADETAEETEDIVDYDEAYHYGENGEAQDDTGADAEYEENGYGEEDGEEEEQAYEEEEERDSSQARQKRSLDDGNDAEEAVASTEYDEGGDAKRVKVDG